jgi:6-phosphofructokinase 1
VSATTTTETHTWADLDGSRAHVRALGPCRVASPIRLGLSTIATEPFPKYVLPGTRVLEQVELAPGTHVDEARAFEKAGPREHIYFEPARMRAGVLTSGGLCPGTNNVIRALVLELIHKYGVASVEGFRYGFAGLDPASGLAPLPLGPDQVRHVHALGGSILGTSRGDHEPTVMVDTLVERGIDMLFAIGGDGTMRGAHAIVEEVDRRGAEIAVVGIPKTVDNDIPFVDKSFGFETAVSMSRVAIDAAHTEAISTRGGIGLVKLMGRDAGFIAAYASIASHDVNVCLVPEVPFRLDGATGLLAHLERRLGDRGHAVIVVAEGCELEDKTPDGGSRGSAAGGTRDSNKLDVGKHLERVIGRHLEKQGVPHHFKYIDPSYMIRGVPADAIDALFCSELARYAVHAAMAGKTDMMVGRLHRVFTHVPLGLVLSEKKRIRPDSELWLAVIESTGQPRFVCEEPSHAHRR